MRIIFILLMLISFTSCDQTGLGIASGVKNFFMTPVNAVKGIFTNKAYERKKEATLKEKETVDVGEKRYCADSDGAPLSEDQLKNLGDLSDQVRSVACQCQPWGDCPKNICSCQALCPQGFDIFRHPADMTPKKISENQYNGLAFRNWNVPSQHEATQGYCWGHARMTSQFNRLSFFKPDSTAPHDLSSSDESEQNKAVDFYKELIDKVADNEAVDIPGFKNLFEFSSHPALQSYIADKVAKGWADQAMSWQGLSTTLSGGQKSNQVYQELFNDVKERIDMNMQPTIVFTERGSPFMTHAVLVSHYEIQSNGQMKLCLRDNNHDESNAAKCEDNMTIDPNKGLIYSPSFWGEIGGIKVAHNENADANSQSESLRKKCQSEKGCANE
ncbi:MAG: hypothetical protein K2P81_09075 [Bacteriovoracaceae bacterium]|nr:hypothetical protein [Bacteriovoracaceae bacterium]